MAIINKTLSKKTKKQDSAKISPQTISNNKAEIYSSKLQKLKTKSQTKTLKLLNSLDNRNKILSLFGNSVRFYRRKLGLSQEDFAWKVGLHRTYVGGIERGERNLSIIKIIDIANALRIRPEDLVLDIDIYMGRV